MVTRAIPGTHEAALAVHIAGRIVPIRACRYLVEGLAGHGVPVYLLDTSLLYIDHKSPPTNYDAAATHRGKQSAVSPSAFGAQDPSVIPILPGADSSNRPSPSPFRKLPSARRKPALATADDAAAQCEAIKIHQFRWRVTCTEVYVELAKL